MTAKTIGFAIAESDRAQLDRLVERFGHGNRSEFLRAAMRVMAVEDRAQRLRSLQSRAAETLGRTVSPDEVNSLVRDVLRRHGATSV